MKSALKNKWLLFILALGTAIRLLWISYVNTQPVFDFKHYHDLAMSLLNTGHYWMPEGLDYIKQDTEYVKQGVHYATAFRPPGYPLVLAALYFVWPNILAAKLANVVFSIVWMFCMYLLTKKYMGERPALWAAFLTAVFPMAVAYTGVVGTEILSVALLFLILCLITYRVGGRVAGPLLIGFLIGFLSLVKPYFAVFPVFYAVIFWWQQRESAKENKPSLRETVRRLVIPFVSLVLMMAVTLSPWTIRNYMAFDRLIPISTNGNFVLYINNNDANNGKYMDAMDVPNSIFKTDRIVDKTGTYNEAVAMKAAKSEATHWILRHPGPFLLLGADRLSLSFFNAGLEIKDWALVPAEIRFAKWLKEPLSQGSRAASLVVAGGGMFYLLLMLYHFVRRPARLNTLHKINLAMILFLLLVIFASEGQPRYLFPIYPFFIIGLCWLGSLVRDNIRSDSAVE
ncbi:glycosyltransferase family 39 protein [Cohnella pontilimi]|uniref:Glycosyltransferase family 39 protein n=1 Tax=Cohnella pontilimi TaxID=2564100 RepID=A0A4U0FB72_9BACL|nr:glycosyltransferase family 39 protein [Cohnella pontilimi]TJY41931.1 glycosyltransferase family 39 protein [Cohnella pontilimi]